MLCFLLDLPPHITVYVSCMDSFSDSATCQSSLFFHKTHNRKPEVFHTMSKSTIATIFLTLPVTIFVREAISSLVISQMVKILNVSLYLMQEWAPKTKNVKLCSAKCQPQIQANATQRTNVVQHKNILLTHRHLDIFRWLHCIWCNTPWNCN